MKSLYYNENKTLYELNKYNENRLSSSYAPLLKSSAYNLRIRQKYGYYVNRDKKKKTTNAISA